jgi:DNA-binding winged helix-turn-helix (wHTH) protein/predicted ATPase
MGEKQIDFPEADRSPQLQPNAILHFGAYRLDPQNEQLWRDQQVIRLTGKSFAVLRYLAEHPKQLVSRSELLRSVWAETIVSATTITSCIKELRKALEDDAKAPRYIETVHRRGYRFIAPLATAPQVVSSQYPVTSNQQEETQKAKGKKQKAKIEICSPVPSTQHPALTLVGRDAELARLHRWLEKALRGERQIVFVTGEAGIGKTTLVETFLWQIEAQERLWLGRGQCIEQYGAGEAYMPVLEALGRLCRESEGGELTKLLHRHAPTWLVQMPALLSDVERETLQRQVGGATRERMLREMAEALEALTAERTLVLWLEDLHWSDYSTLELLSALAKRSEQARLLVLGTYRSVEVLVRDLKRVTQELQLHGHCQELALGFLSEDAVGQYLTRRFAGRRLPAGLEKIIHHHTEGNPLFMVNVTDYLEKQGVLDRDDGEQLWRILDTARIGVPENLRQLIERQIEQVSSVEQAVLAAASVAGTEFSAAAVAAGLGTESEAVEEMCAGLARRGQFLVTAGAAEWPDSTLAARYRFIHALYHDVLYERVPPGRRASLHLRIGERQEHAYQHRLGEVAAELAVQFERGRDFRRAIQYLGQAAQNAMWTYAYHEAIDLLNKGLALLPHLPASAERTQQELTLQVGLSVSLMHTQGFVAPVVEQAYTRTRVLCQEAGDSLPRFAALWGLRNFHTLRGELQAGRAAAQEFLERVRRTDLSFLAAEAHLGVGTPLFHLGEFGAARTHIEQSLALCDPQTLHRHVFLTGQDPRASGLAHLALLLWIVGYPDQARERSRQALALARDALFPYGQALALNLAAILQLGYRDTQRVEQLAKAARSFAHECGFIHLMVIGIVLQGWALVMRGKGEEGVALMQAGLERQHALGIGIGEVSYQMLLADAYAKTGQVEAGMQVLAAAFTAIEKTEERTYEAEVYRLKGQLVLQSGVRSLKSEVTDPRLLAPDPRGEAEACFHKAIEIARRQSAKSLELRAVMSLSRLWQQQGKKSEAARRLAEIYNWFTEGFDTADLCEAKSLLVELA